MEIYKGHYIKPVYTFNTGKSILIMTPQQLHRAIYLAGLLKSSTIHREKIEGRMVGPDEMKYYVGAKYMGARVKFIYETVTR